MLAALLGDDHQAILRLLSRQLPDHVVVVGLGMGNGRGHQNRQSLIIQNGLGAVPETGRCVVGSADETVGQLLTLYGTFPGQTPQGADTQVDDPTVIPGGDLGGNMLNCGHLLFRTHRQLPQAPDSLLHLAA